MRIRVLLLFAALSAPIAAFASNHNADNQSVVDVEVMRSGRHVYVITYTAGTHFYADETRSGAAGRIQCTWNLNATLSRTLEIDNKLAGPLVAFRAAALPPDGGIATEKGKFCEIFKSETGINQQVYARLTKPFWDAQIQDDMKALRQQYKFKLIAPSTSRSTAAYRRTLQTRPLHNFAMTCFRTKDAVCKYQFIKMVARSWIIAPTTPVPGIATQLTDADRAQLAAYIDQIGSAAKEDPAIDKIVDQILDKVKEKAFEAIGISASTVSNWTLAGEVLTTGAPNGTVSEDKLIELSRDTDAQLDAEEARTDAFIATLSTIAATSPNASVKASSAVLLSAYCQAFKSAIAAERQRRVTSAKGAASGAAPGGGGHNDGPANSLPGAGGGPRPAEPTAPKPAPAPAVPGPTPSAPTPAPPTPTPVAPTPAPAPPISLPLGGGGSSPGNNGLRGGGFAGPDGTGLGGSVARYRLPLKPSKARPKKVAAKCRTRSGAARAADKCKANRPAIATPKH